MRILFSFHTSACVCVCIAGGLRGWRVVNTQGMRQPSTASARVVRFGRHAPRGHRTEPAAVAAAGSHPSAVVASAYDGSRRHRCRRRTRLPSTAVLRTHRQRRRSRVSPADTLVRTPESIVFASAADEGPPPEDADFSHDPDTGDH